MMILSRCSECLDAIQILADLFIWQLARNYGPRHLCRGCAQWRRDGVVRPATEGNLQ